MRRAKINHPCGECTAGNTVDAQVFAWHQACKHEMGLRTEYTDSVLTVQGIEKRLDFRSRAACNICGHVEDRLERSEHRGKLEL